MTMRNTAPQPSLLGHPGHFSPQIINPRIEDKLDKLSRSRADEAGEAGNVAQTSFMSNWIKNRPNHMNDMICETL